MSTRPYRFRKCQRCGDTFPAGELKPTRLGTGHWHKQGGSLRRCPSCGHVDFTGEFPIVLDTRNPEFALPKRQPRANRRREGWI